MGKLAYQLGRKFGASLVKGKWYYQSLFGSPEKALEAEIIVGRELAQKVIQENPLSSDLEKKKLLQEIGNKLSARVTNKSRKFQFRVLQSSGGNAFALPGGFIFVTEALVRFSENNPNEIAFLLAHEMVHVLLRHPFQRILARFSSNLVANVLLKKSSLGIFGRQVVSELLAKSYSREKELQADSYAVRFMNSAGYNPDGAVRLLNRLAAHDAEKNPLYRYFLSHPSPADRVMNIQRVIDEYRLIPSNSDERSRTGLEEPER